jgi:hydroxypyruvate isomerase
VDLLPAEDWSTAKQYGLVCSTGYGGAGTITDGLSDPANHDGILRNLERTLPKAAAAGVPNIITFFGSRLGMSDAEGITNCVSALKQIAPIAEQQGVTVIAELLNSKIDHTDYIGDNTTFGVNSPRVKLLYDIYHMQVMEGNIIHTIQENHRYIGHYHTAGVPGRGELSRQQELNWPVIAQTIAATGFSGFVAHEFSAATSSWEPMRKALNLFDVQRYPVAAEFRS